MIRDTCHTAHQCNMITHPNEPQGFVNVTYINTTPNAFRPATAPAPTTTVPYTTPNQHYDNPHTFCTANPLHPIRRENMRKWRGWYCRRSQKHTGRSRKARTVSTPNESGSVEDAFGLTGARKPAKSFRGGRIQGNGKPTYPHEHPLLKYVKIEPLWAAATNTLPKPLVLQHGVRQLSKRTLGNKDASNSHGATAQIEGETTP